MSNLSEDPFRIPVVAGIGELTDRDNSIEPRTLIVEAVRRALAEAGGLAEQIDSLDVVSVASFRYEDIAGLVAADAGLAPSRAIESVVGGEKPIRLLGEAAERIAAGEDRAAIICGGEAMRTRAHAAKNGIKLDWGPADPGARPSSPLDYVTEQSARHGLTQPVNVYPLYENATRRSWNQTLAEGQAESAALWHRYSLAAAANPYAWLGREVASDTVEADTPDNRMIAFPYRKLMVANPMVNQAAAVLVTSLGRAREWGLAETDLVFVGSGARANEPRDFLTRDRFDRSSAQDIVLAHTLEANGIIASNVDRWELYSCFPTVPKMARRALGLDRAVSPSIAGGLTFFGAPANNYMTHAITAAVRALRGEAGNAFLYGQGEFVTKHSAILLSGKPPERRPAMRDVQSEADAAMGERPDLLASYEGPATVETFTIIYDRNGEAAQLPIVVRTPAGARTVALGDLRDEKLAAYFASPDADPIGSAGVVRAAEGETLLFSRV